MDLHIKRPEQHKMSAAASWLLLIHLNDVSLFHLNNSCSVLFTDPSAIKTEPQTAFVQVGISAEFVKDSIKHDIGVVLVQFQENYDNNDYGNY